MQQAEITDSHGAGLKSDFAPIISPQSTLDLE